MGKPPDRNGTACVVGWERHRLAAPAEQEGKWPSAESQQQGWGRGESSREVVAQVLGGTHKVAAVFGALMSEQESPRP